MRGSAKTPCVYGVLKKAFAHSIERGMKRRTTWILIILVILILAGWGAGRAFKALKPAVGILEIDGVITESVVYLDAIRDFERDDTVKAVVVRLDSPGGKVGPSQEIHAALASLRRKKPVVASLGALGASGAYYIACAADTVYALPGTMTGSIGVIMEFFDASEGLRRVGLQAKSVTSGALKDAGSPFRPMTDAERAYFKDLVDDVHAQFVEAVSKGRRLKPERVKALADGRIFTGRQAMGLGLVDRLGGLDDAVREAGRRASIEGEPRIVKAGDQKGAWDMVKRFLKTTGPALPGAVRLFEEGRTRGSVSLEYSIP